VAFLTSYSQLFTAHPERLTLAHLLQQGPMRIIGARLAAMRGNLIEVAVQVGIITFLLGAAGTIRRRREPALAAVGTHYLVLFFFTALLFPYPTRQGTFGHAFTGMVPLVVGAAFVAFADWHGGGAARVWRRASAWAVTAVMMAVYLATLGPSMAHTQDTSRKRQALEWHTAAALELLNPDGRVVVHWNAWDYYYLTMRPALMMPRDEYGSIIALARRFGAPLLATNQVVYRHHRDFPQAWRDDRYVALVAEPVRPVQIFQLLYQECVGKELDHLQLARTHSRAGIGLSRAGHEQSAEIELRKAASLAPEVPEAHYNLALVLDALGRRAEAVTETERALRLQPGDRKATQLLERLRRQASPPRPEQQGGYRRQPRG